MQKSTQSLRKKYYQSVEIKYELLRSMKDREVILMNRTENWKCIRGLRIANIPFMDIVFQLYGIDKHDYNIYVSLAKYRHIPSFELDLTKRSKQTSKWFRTEAIKEVESYDIFLDFDKPDNTDFRTFFKEVLRMVNILDYEEIMFRIYPSGSGIQVVIENSLFIYHECKKILKNIKKVFALKYLDLVGAGVFNKIRKCEYSIVDQNVVFPQEIRGLDTNIYQSIYIYDILCHPGLGKRGLKNNNDWDTKYNSIALKKFIKKYDLLEA